MKLEQETEIGNQIAMYREKAGLTQQKLGDKIGLTQDQIGLLERGQRNWKLSTLIKLTNVLDINLVTLFQSFEQSDEKMNQLIKKIEYSPKKEVFIKAFNDILDASKEN